MKKLGFIFILIISLISLIGCRNNDAGNSDTNSSDALEPGVSTEYLNNNYESFVIIDIRNKSEYLELHLKNSTNIVYNEKLIDNFKYNKNDRIILYSNNDNKSKALYDLIVDLGYKDIHYLIGGINKWIDDGFYVVKNTAKPYSRVFIDNNKHNYKSTAEISLSLSPKAYDDSYSYLSLYNKYINYKLINSSDEIILEDKILVANTYNLKIKPNTLKPGKYRLEFIIEGDSYINLESFYTLNINNEDINEELLSFDSLKNKGHFDGFNDYKYLFDNILKNIGGISLLNRADEKIKIGSLINNRPTILMISSPSCHGCEKTLEYLMKLDLSEVNLYYILTYTDGFNNYKDDIIHKLNSLGFNLDNLYFDDNSYLASKILNMDETPELLFINSNEEIINIYRNNNEALSSLNSFMSYFNKALKDSFNLELNKKEATINITIADYNGDASYTINKGEVLPKMDKPKREGYRFIGYSINGAIIDIDNYIFNEDTRVQIEYKKTHLDSNELKDIKHVLIDLRKKEKYNKGHLEGAINIEEAHIRLEIDSHNIEYDNTLILYGVRVNYEILDFLNSIGYEAYYLEDYEEPKIIEWTLEERKENGELDWYFENRPTEKNNLVNNYGKSYLDLEFISYDKSIVKLSSMLRKNNKPTIIMIGQRVCGACDYAWDRFIEMKDSFEFNFLEVMMLNRNIDINSYIDNELASLDQITKKNYIDYRILDVNNHTRAALVATETPIFYILDGKGNLTNLKSSFTKAIDYACEIDGTISVIEHKREEAKEGDMRLQDRINNNEYLHIKDNKEIYELILNKYSSFILKQKYYDIYHSVRSISGFFNLNGYPFDNRTVIYILNSANSDFNKSLSFLDSLDFSKLNYNFLIIMDDNKNIEAELLKKSYKDKIMLDDNSVNVNSEFVNYHESYFIVLDSFGNLTNATLDFNSLDNILLAVGKSKSVKSPASLTEGSVIKPGDNIIKKDQIIDLGFISHIDSQRDMARLEYLNVNFGRSYLNIELTNNNGNKVMVKDLIDNKRPTILCFIQSYQDDYYYNFNPLYELRNRANIIIIFTNAKNEPYNNLFVDRMLGEGKKRAIEVANKPQNREAFKEQMRKNNPNASDSELEKLVDEYLNEVYDYTKMKDYIYGSTAKYTTPLLDTIVRGIQLYLDRNGNLANISQSYYNVGNTFSSVLDKIGDYICIEG